MYLDGFKNKITALCEKYHVEKLWVFGSVLTGRFTPQSDIDLIVSFGNVPLETYADNYFDFKYSLENMFERPVDLLEQKAIKNPYLLENLDRTKQIIYG